MLKLINSKQKNFLSKLGIILQKRKIQNPKILTTEEIKTELFFVSFSKIYLVKKNKPIENNTAKKIIKYRRMVDTPLNSIQLILLLKLLLLIPKCFHYHNLFSKS